MVLICGIPTETPLRRVKEELLCLGSQVIVFNQRYFDQTELDWKITHGKVSGRIVFGDAGYRLEDFKGVYLRLMDENVLPEVQGEANREKRKLCHAIHEALMQWLEVSPARVVNRLQAMLSNGSKPYQMQLIRQFGFKIPETLITNDPEEVWLFHQKHKRIIYKSISGIRSIVKEFDHSDEEKLEKIRWCPVQFQAFVEGEDVRVHVIGKKIIATKIISEATDYRYASREDKNISLEVFEPDEKVKERCISLTRSLGLAFSGIDLRYTPQGEVYCFEVNPSPGYSFYESHTDQPIARTVAQYLLSGQTD